MRSGRGKIAEQRNVLARLRASDADPDPHFRAVLRERLLAAAGDRGDERIDPGRLGKGFLDQGRLVPPQLDPPQSDQAPSDQAQPDHGQPGFGRHDLGRRNHDRTDGPGRSDG